MPLRLRTVAVWVAGVLAVLSLTAATVAVWARTSVADSDLFASIATDVLDDADVQAALADRIADQVFTAVGADRIVASLFVGPLAGLEVLQATLQEALHAALESRIERLLSADRVQAIVATAVERAHEAALQLLRGDGLVDGITIVDGAVTLNLLPLVGIGLAQLQELGLLAGVELPDLTRDGDPDQQVAALSAAFGRDLPAGFGQVVIYESDRVAAATESVRDAQRAAVVGLRTFWILVALAIVLVIATLALGRDRWRVLMALSLATFVAMVVVRSVVHRIGDEAPGLADGPGGQAAAGIVIDRLADGLLTISAALLAAGVAGTVVGIVRRRSRRGDIELAAAVVVGAGTVALLGISIVALLTGVATAIVTVVVGRYLGERLGPGREVNRARS